MSVALYMDVHVPRAITRALRVKGVDVLTAQEDGTAKLDDNLLLDRAGALERGLFSRDEDFFAEADGRQRRGEPFPGVIYGHQLRVGIGQCIADLELIAKACEFAELSGRVWHLPLRSPASPGASRRSRRNRTKQRFGNDCVPECSLETSRVQCVTFTRSHRCVVAERFTMSRTSTVFTPGVASSPPT